MVFQLPRPSSRSRIYYIALLYLPIDYRPTPHESKDASHPGKPTAVLAKTANLGTGEELESESVVDQEKQQLE